MLTIPSRNTAKRLPSRQAVVLVALVLALGPAGCGSSTNSANVPKPQDQQQIDSEMEKAAIRNKNAGGK